MGHSGATTGTINAAIIDDDGEGGNLLSMRSVLCAETGGAAFRSTEQPVNKLL